MPKKKKGNKWIRVKKSKYNEIISAGNPHDDAESLVTPSSSFEIGVGNGEETNTQTDSFSRMAKKRKNLRWAHTQKNSKRAKATAAPQTISKTQEEPPPALKNDDLNAVTPESEFRRLTKLLYLKYGADWRKRQSTTDGADSINTQDLVEDGYVVDIGHVGINNQVIDTNQIYTIDAFEAKMEDDIDLGSSNEQVDQNVPLSIRKEIPLENEEIFVHITAESDTQMMERVDVTSDTSTDEVDQNVALSIREEIPPGNEENVEHITTDRDTEMVESENESFDSSTETASSDESSENSSDICGLCRKSVVNKIICIKCETPFHAACFEKAVSKKSSSCQHIRIQDEQAESTEHLKLQVDLLNKLVEDMARKNEISLKKNRLLSEKVERIEKNNKSLENKIETLQEKNRYLKKINKCLEKKVPLVSLSINK